MQKVRLKNHFLKVSEIKDLSLSEVMMKVRVLVFHTITSSVNMLKNQALTDFVF